MVCTACGESLEEVTVIDDGGRRCPKCGNLSLPIDLETTAAFANEIVPKLLAPERFRLKSILGRGSFGVVYEAWDDRLQREVAVKVPFGKLSDRELFLREARAASHLKHSNIVRIFDVITDDQYICIISELVSGQCLRSLLSKGALSIQEACRMVATIARAIHYAHENGVIHRDLKPGNVVINQNGEPLVLDFGLSFSRSRNLLVMNKSGHPIGTPAYMSPEQVQGLDSEIGPATDCYSLGVMLFQLLVGRLPFHGDSHHIFESIQRSPPPNLCELSHKIPPSLNAICQRAMAKQPVDRFSSLEVFAEELERFLDGRRVLSYPKPEWRVARAFVRRHAIVISSSLLTAGCISVLYGMRRHSDPVQAKIRVSLDCTRTSAQLAWYLIDPRNCEETLQLRCRANANPLPELCPGFYRIVALDGGESFECFRTIPALNVAPIDSFSGVPIAHRSWEVYSDRIVLPPIRFISSHRIDQGMSFHSGGEIYADSTMGAIGGKRHAFSPFLIDVDEVRVGEFLNICPKAEWMRQMDHDQPATSVTFDMALMYAEAVGKSLPTVWEYLWAATNHGTTRFPWGDDPLPAQLYWQEPRQNSCDFDKTRSNPQVLRLYSGVSEWTSTCPPGEIEIDKTRIVSPTNGGNGLLERAVVGGPRALGRGSSAVECEVDFVDFRSVSSSSPNIGFRCVRRIHTS